MNHQREKSHTCQFCQGKCSKGERHIKRWWWWKCKTCNAVFLFSIKGDLAMIELQTKEEVNHNYRFYTAHIDIREKKTSFYIWTRFSFLNSNKKIEDYKMDLLKRFDSILEITPQNVEHKIKTIATFL